MKIYCSFLLCLISAFLIPGCGKTSDDITTPKNDMVSDYQEPAIDIIPTDTTKPENIGSSEPEPVNEPESLIIPTGNTIMTRILPPKGYERTDAPNGSFDEFLRNYPLLPDGSPVLLYDGSIKQQQSAVCVFNMYLGEKDLQQCADSVMRIYAEYMRIGENADKIAFHFVNGFLCDWSTYKNGNRITLNGNDVSWTNKAEASDSDDTFESYLETVYTYAGTISLDKESEPIELSDLSIGDIFITAGSPGHVVMVADTCINDGKKAFLLAQGYMPAQQFHVLKNAAHEEDPWYYEDEVVYPFVTPEYIFSEPCLKRPTYLSR